MLDISTRPMAVLQYWRVKAFETIRRDGVEATQKMMSKVFMELFENRNLSSLRNYMQKQWSKIMTGHVNFKDFVFSREVRLGKYISIPPAGLVALNKMSVDPMAAPKYRERVKYIVIAGKEGSRVKDLVVSPEAFLKSHNHKLHSRYYIENVINAAMGRQFASFNIDVSEWYYNMPKGINKQTLLVNDTHFMGSTTRSTSKNVNYNLEHFYKFQICVVCLEPTEKHIVCERCLKEPIITKQLAYQKIKYYQNDYSDLEDLCRGCAGFKLQGFSEVPCEMMDCPIFYNKRMAKDCTEQIVPSLEDAIKQLDSGLTFF